MPLMFLATEADFTEHAFEVEDNSLQRADHLPFGSGLAARVGSPPSRHWRLHKHGQRYGMPRGWVLFRHDVRMQTCAGTFGCLAATTTCGGLGCFVVLWPRAPAPSTVVADSPGHESFQEADA